MAIADKLQTVASGVSDIRTVLNTVNSSLGNGNISTLDDDIRKIINSTRVVKQNPYKIEYVINNGTTMTTISGSDIIEIVVPSTVTSIPASGITNCSNLTSLFIPNNVTSIGNFAFEGCTSLNLTIDGTCTLGSNVFRDVQKLVLLNRSDFTPAVYVFDNIRNVNNTGVFILDGNLTKNSGIGIGDWSIIRITGNVECTAATAVTGMPKNKAFYINGDLKMTNGYFCYVGTGSNLSFIEVGGNVTGGYVHRVNGSQYLADGFIWHFAKTDGIACSATLAAASYSRVGKIYVGDGSSQSADQTVLDMYLADSDWSAYSSKLDTWYNYVQSGGEYATPPTI